MKLKKRSFDIAPLSLLNGRSLNGRPLDRRPSVRAAAQISPLPQGAPQSPPGPASPSFPDPEAAPDAPGNRTPGAAPRGRRPITFYVDTRFGFDSQSAVINVPFPLEVDIKRRIRSVVLAAEYPLSTNARVFASVPYVDQTTRSISTFGTLRQSGRGVGDIALFLERRFPEIARGTELSLALGMQFPTGKDQFEIGANQLPTGVGFYQPLARATIRKLRVPLQLYAALDYGTSLSRRVNGNKLRLPDSYGGELGFYYSLGPEFTAQTGLSYSKLTSPFLLDPGATVAYLSQSLTYRSGARTTLRGSVDVGLTDDSTDAYVGFALNRIF